MSKSSKNEEFIRILKDLELRLVSIEKSIDKLELRMQSIERKAERSFQLPPENPLLYSKTLHETLEEIRDYEIRQKHGITAKQLANMRRVVLPTIYEQLTKLEEANLIFWQRGSEIGLKPANAKFYSLMEREYLLSDLPVLMNLPEKVIPLAQHILKKSETGASRSALMGLANGLAKNKRSPWSLVERNMIEDAVDECLQYLLQTVLIERVFLDDEVLFYPRIAK